MIANWRRRRYVVTALGISQIVGFGTTYYLPAVLAHPIANDTGWSYTAVVSGLSLAMIVSGLVATRVGRAIDAYGGRPVLAASAVTSAAGMAMMGLAPRLEVYLLGWFIIGLGMSAGLYDAVFSALGRLYGVTARSPISWVTLFGGFASTVCWPLSAWLVEAYGWRATCLTYAAVYLLINLPAFVVFVPDTPRRVVVAGGPPPDLEAARRHRVSLTLMMLISTVASMIASTVAVHLLAIIQANGVTSCGCGCAWDCAWARAGRRAYGRTGFWQPSSSDLGDLRRCDLDRCRAGCVGDRSNTGCSGADPVWRRQRHLYDCARRAAAGVV